MKEASKKEFGVEGLSYTRRKLNIDPSDVKQTQKSVRSFHKTTQEELRNKGIKKVKLFRGVKKQYSDIGVLESWSSDREIAKKFNGQFIIEEEVPIERILTFSKSSKWTNGPFGEQSEYIVIRDVPKK